MNHFGIGQWVDFARNLVAADKQTAMRNHLATGCKECGDEAAFFGRLAVVTQAMTAVAPEWAVARALAIVPGRTPKPARRVFRIPVELIYDSFLVPAPAGLRSTWQVGWQALFRAGDCSLDLRIEPELRSSRASVIGQISNYTVPDQRMADLAVRLKAGKLVVAETRSNQFGEFQMEYEQQGRLQLCVYLDGGSRSIQVPLKNFGSAPQKKRSRGDVV
jgi:hypothetical protein